MKKKSKNEFHELREFYDRLTYERAISKYRKRFAKIKNANSLTIRDSGELSTGLSVA